MTFAIVELGEIAEIRSGFGFPVELQGRPDGDYPFAKVGDISKVVRSGRFQIGNADHYVDRVDLGRLKATPFPSGSIVFAKIGEAIRQNFRAISTREMLFDNNVMGIIPDAAKIRTDYFYRFLNTLDFYKIANATSVPSIRRTEIARVKVPLPPLEEQKRIAEVLDKADALRQKRRLALQTLDTLLQSVFIDMFGDPVSNPKGWEVKTLDQLGDVLTGTTPSSLLSGMFDGDIPFVTPSDLKETWVESSRTLTEAGATESRTVSAGATFVCCIGATIGKMGKAATRSAFNQQINAVSWSDEVDANFGLELMRFFKSKIASDGASTTLPILKKSLFQKIGVPVPPSDLQFRYSKIVESVEQMKAAYRKHVTEVESLFASLQSRAFRGELNAG